MSVRSLRITHKSFPEVDRLRKFKTENKKVPAQHHETTMESAGYIQPVLGTNFEGNQPNGSAPNDNIIAISVDGWIVSMINSNLCVYDRLGYNYLSVSLYGLVDHLDTDLSGSLYDPKVIYDVGSDRFIIVFLHEFSAPRSKVVVGFSAYNDPRYDWYFYTFGSEDELGSEGCWFDYPNIAVSAADLYVSGNMFNSEGDYDHPMLLHIRKEEGYDGARLRYQTWANFKDADGYRPFTVVPVQSGTDLNYGPGIYLVNTWSGWASNVTLYDMTNDLEADDEELVPYSIVTPTYNIGGEGFILDREERLSIADCRIRNACYVDGIVHFVFHSDYDSTGWNGVNYNRLDVDAKTNRSIHFANPGYDYAYPAVAWFGEKEGDKAAMVGFLCASKTNYPQIRVVSFDDAGNPSGSLLVKRGSNYFGDYDETKKSVRWGDYSGICRDFGSSTPKVWMAGEYGRLDKLRGTWIAEITGILTSVNENAIPAGETIQGPSLFPNPAYDTVNFSFHLQNMAQVTVRVYDIRGRLVKEIFKGTARAGQNRLSFNRLVLSSGNYFVQISSEGKILKYEKLLVAR